MSLRKNLYRIGAVPALTLGLALPGALVACDEVADAAGALCCEDFDVGADLSGVDFEADATFAVWIQAVADFSGVANAMVTDVTASCKALAIDLGADEDTSAEGAPSDPSEAVTYWCQLATAQINAEIKAQGTLTIEVQAPSCTVDVKAQASCEANCQVDASCDPGGVEARCDPGELKGKCEGSCSGSCQGSANLAVSCEGSCEGTCSGSCAGSCEGKCDGNENSGNCAGHCEGSCSADCQGSCRGECTMSGGANVECEGECKGGCDVTIKAPKCDVEIDPPACDVDADCEGSCEASASAKAECKPPTVEISFSGTLDASMKAKIGALKLHLPNLFLAAKARAEALVAAGGAVLDLSLKLDPGQLSGKAALCILPAASAIGNAMLNAEAGLSASVSVVTTVGG